MSLLRTIKRAILREQQGNKDFAKKWQVRQLKKYRLEYLNVQTNDTGRLCFHWGDMTLKQVLKKVGGV